jgi:hypothetical protein
MGFKTYEQLQEDNDFMMDLLKKYKGVDHPFICGAGADVGEDGLPDYIMVCPAMGSDGFAIYKKHRDFSSPSY